MNYKFSKTATAKYNFVYNYGKSHYVHRKNNFVQSKNKEIH